MENNTVKDAKISGTLYRGFEEILLGRSAMDAPYYAERICGICSTAHAVASSLALEQALGMAVPANGLLLRNLIFAADILQNHLSHFYLLFSPDYFRGPDIAPFLPHPEVEYRLTSDEETQFTEHYFQALEICRFAHAAFTVFGGKAPHGHGIMAGGVTADADFERITHYKSYLTKIADFIDHVMISDVELLFKRYPEMIDSGRGPGNYIGEEGFPTPDGNFLFAQGVILEGKREAFDQNQITEDVTTAWYKQHQPLHPGKETTIPDRGQPKGYSWVKAPRYKGLPMETGPLARAIIAREKVPGYGALARVWARVQEAKKIAASCFQWLDQLNPGAPTINTKVSTDSGIGVGLHPAMRGSLGHWIEIEHLRIKHYQIVTPTAWNFSSRDAQGIRSAAESALLNVEIDKNDHDYRKIGSIVRSFDPCFSCSVHLMEGERYREFMI